MTKEIIIKYNEEKSNIHVTKGQFDISDFTNIILSSDNENVFITRIWYI